MSQVELRPYSIPAAAPDGRQFWLTVLLTEREAQTLSELDVLATCPKAMCTLEGLQPVADVLVASLQKGMHVAAGGALQ